MAQIAGTLAGKVSDEWIHNLLQIHDSNKMQADILSENAMKAAFEQDLPNLVGQMLAMFGPQGAPGGAAAGGAAVPGATPPAQPEQPLQAVPPQGMPPEGMPSPEMMQAGAQGMPLQEPMPPEQAMGGVAR